MVYLKTQLFQALAQEKPSEAFLKIEDLYPEITALKGRPQPVLHHPEGDAYVHTLLTIDRARELAWGQSERLYYYEIMFSALVHDLGKAVTPDDELPKHLNHEALGADIVRQFCEKLEITPFIMKCALLTTRKHLLVHRWNELRPITKVRLLQKLEADKTNEIAMIVTTASKADAQGRGPLFYDKAYPQREAILEAATIYRDIVLNHLGYNPQRLEQVLVRAFK